MPGHQVRRRDPNAVPWVGCLTAFGLFCIAWYFAATWWVNREPPPPNPSAPTVTASGRRVIAFEAFGKLPVPDLAYDLAVFDRRAGVASADKTLLRLQLASRTADGELDALARHLVQFEIVEGNPAAVCIFIYPSAASWQDVNAIARYDYLPRDRDWMTQGHRPDYTIYQLTCDDLRY